MNDQSSAPITDARLLAAMRAVNPPLEKLMEDRLALRLENREAKARLAEAIAMASQCQSLWDRHTLRYITTAKRVTLGAASILLIALSIALFTPLLHPTLITPLLLSLILPLWMIEMAEKRLNGGQHIALIGGASRR